MSKEYAELREKIAEWFMTHEKPYTTDTIFLCKPQDSDYELADQILALIIPKEKPPLLGSIEVLKAMNALPLIAGSRASHNKMQIGRQVAKAQRESDIKHYEEVE